VPLSIENSLSCTRHGADATPGAGNQLRLLHPHLPQNAIQSRLSTFFPPRSGPCLAFLLVLYPLPGTKETHPLQPTNTYYPWSECKPRLDATPSGMATFAGPFPSSPPPQPQPSSATSVSAAPSSATDPSTAPPATSTAPPEDPSGEDLELAETANATGEQHDDDDDDDDDDDAELDTDFPSPPPPGCLDPNNLPIELLAETFVIQRRTLMPFLVRALAVNTTGFPIISS
jgi:hypothetical protein